MTKNQFQTQPDTKIKDSRQLVNWENPSGALAEASDQISGKSKICQFYSAEMETSIKQEKYKKNHKHPKLESTTTKSEFWRMSFEDLILSITQLQF